MQGQCFQKSKAAYNAGDGAQAKNLSEEGHMHQQRKDQLNHEAASWIFNGPYSLSVLWFPEIRL